MSRAADRGGAGGPVDPWAASAVDETTHAAADADRAPADEPRGGAGVRIRAFEWSDYDRVIALWRSVGLRLGVSDEPAELQRTLDRDPALFLVAERDAAVVGVVLGTFDGRRGWLHHLAVDGAWHGTGVGRLLVERAEGLLRERGCGKVNLHIEPDNTGVVGFYERLGYSVRPIVFMEKWL